MKTVFKDYLVLGAGPAGLQSGYFLQKSGRDYLILDRAAKAGSFFETYPRHDQLLSINKRYTGFADTEINLRWDWNSLLCDSEDMLFRNFSKDYYPDRRDLVRYLQAFVDHYQLALRGNTDIIRIDKKDGRFVLEDRTGQTFSCNRLIIATGIAEPWIPEIPGIDHRNRERRELEATKRSRI